MRLPLCVLLLAGRALCDWDFDAKDGYFEQDDDGDSVTTELSNWGLSSDYTWDTLLARLQEKTDADDEKYYKLVFFARHGEAWHNVVEDEVGDDAWDDVCTQDSYDGVNLFDDDLTDDGVSEVQALATAWQTQISTNGMPTPDSYYVSPLQRALHTFELTWGSSLSGVIVEDLRERAGECVCYERHSKTWIAENFPQMTFQDGFTEEDELWTTERESKSDVEDRCHDFLKWLNKNDDSYVISVTSHSDTIKECLKEIGHSKHSLAPGEVLPVVIEAKHT